MKTEYEEKVYQFFTEEKNYEMMLKVASHYDAVTDRLVKEFWDDVIDRLKKETESMDGSWIVKYSQEWGTTYNKVSVYDTAWVGKDSQPLISISFEHINMEYHPYVGVTLHRDSKEVDSNVMKELLLGMPQLTNAYKSDSNQWWACWKHLSFDFNENDDLLKLLAQNRQPLIEECAQEVSDLLDLIKDQVQEFLQQSRY